MILLARFWPYIAAVGGVLVMLAGVYQTGYNAAWRKADAANMRVQIETLQRDRDIAAKTAIRTAETNAELERLRNDDEAKIDALRKIVHDGPDRGLTQSELDGLLGIK